MKKRFLVLISLILIFITTSCVHNLEGTVSNTTWNDVNYKVYLFDSEEDVRLSLKYIENEEWGQIPLNNSLEEQWDNLKNTFTFDEQKNEKYPSRYPDFSNTNCQFMAIPGSIKRVVSNSGYIEKYYRVAAIIIYKYDFEKNLCSERIEISTGYYL